jgi:hypothetical protein
VRRLQHTVDLARDQHAQDVGSDQLRPDTLFSPARS